MVCLEAILPGLLLSCVHTKIFYIFYIIVWDSIKYANQKSGAVRKIPNSFFARLQKQKEPHSDTIIRVGPME